MPDDLLEIAEAGVTAVNETYRTGDMTPWRRHVENVFDPEVVLEPDAGVFTEGEWRGHEGAVGFVANQMEVLEGMWLRGEEFVLVDERTLLAAVSFGGTARHTGLDFELKPFHVFHLRDRKVVRWQVFTTREAAMEAAGGGA